MPTARTLANIKKHHYRVLIRTTPAALVAANYDTAAHFATFLATFDELGYARDKSIKFPIVEGDSEILDYPAGTKKVLGYTLNGETILLQSDPADDALLDALEGTAADVLLYSQSTGKCRFYGNVVLNFEEQANAGETETTTLKVARENAASKADIRTIFTEPLV